MSLSLCFLILQKLDQVITLKLVNDPDNKIGIDLSVIDNFRLNQVKSIGN